MILYNLHLWKQQVYWHLWLATPGTQRTPPYWDSDEDWAKINVQIKFYSTDFVSSNLTLLISSFSSSKLIFVDCCILSLLSFIRLQRCFKHERYSTFTAAELDIEPSAGNYRHKNFPILWLLADVNIQQCKTQKNI